MIKCCDEMTSAELYAAKQRCNYYIRQHNFENTRERARRAASLRQEFRIIHRGRATQARKELVKFIATERRWLRKMSREAKRRQKEYARAVWVAGAEDRKERARVKNNEGARRWAKDNKHRHCQKTRLYRSRSKKAKPGWAIQEKIDVYYQKRDEYNGLWGTRFEVDHIVPLNGKTVCGLHCEDNLQLLDKPLNTAKNALYWVDQ